MNRRSFLLLCSVLLTKNIYGNNDVTTPWNIINSTLEHLFPKHNNFKGSNSIGLDQFLSLVSQDSYFNKRDLRFLIFGAKKLYQKYPSFLQMDHVRKEKALREFEKEYQNWLSLLLYYGFEGMLGDPIYGGNKNRSGWIALKHNPGLPRPKTKYGKAYV